MPSVLINGDTRRFTSRIIERAKEKLKSFDSSESKIAKKLIHTKVGVLFKLDLGKAHRLVSSNKKEWKLYTHEEYSSTLMGRGNVRRKRCK